MSNTSDKVWNAVFIAGITAAVTGWINYNISTKTIDAGFDSWRKQFDSQNAWQRQNDAQKISSEIAHHFRRASDKASQINSNLVEIHVYEATAKMIADENNSIIREMRSNQSILVERNSLHGNELRDHKGEYEWRIRHLSNWMNEASCASDLIQVASGLLSTSIPFEIRIGEISLEFAKKGRAPYEAVKFLREEVYHNEISFDDEVSHFNDRAVACFSQAALPLDKNEAFELD